MKTQVIDGIYGTKKFRPAEPEIRPPILSQIVSPPGSPKRKRWFWSWFWGGLFLIILIGGILFWRGLLGEKLALLRLLFGLNGKYLVLFQNNTELRPSGGFIGSFAEADFGNGLLKNYYFETNIYKKDKELSKKLCLPQPAPLEKVWPGACFLTHNSNWSADFPESAEQVAWFYKQRGGNKIDGVIAIDTTFFTELLKLTGQIEMPEYNLILNADNFVKETQYYVEQKYWNEPENWQINEPKTILKALLPKAFARLKNPRLFLRVLALAEKHLDSKHLLFYSRERQLSALISRYNWGGEVKRAAGDYLYINNANLAGGKSSLNVVQKIDLKSQIQKDGSIINTLSITRTHQGTGAWPDSVNQNYTRVLVPAGSILQGKKNIAELDFQQELGKAIFGFWSTVAPGETKSFEISYLLPFKKDTNYGLLIQKQPGTLSDQFNFTLEGASRWKWEGGIDKDKEINVDLTEKD